MYLKSNVFFFFFYIKEFSTSATSVLRYMPSGILVSAFLRFGGWDIRLNLCFDLY